MFVCSLFGIQELFQDYQFLNPESDYEVAVKLGPVTTSKDARVLAEEWRKQCREHFEAKKCAAYDSGSVFVLRCPHWQCYSNLSLSLGASLASSRVSTTARSAAATLW